MRWYNYFFVFSLLILTSCLARRSDKQTGNSIAGNWLILFPDHELANEKQRAIYARVQDSIVNLLGLKTISFREDGSFLQTDSIYRLTGKWHFNEENKSLFIRDAGKGLDFFKGRFIGITNDTMRMEEWVTIDGEPIRLTWFLKRMSEKRTARLFGEEANSWRKRNPLVSEAQYRRKLEAMLRYYSLYFEIVSKESAYFSQTRVFLPFRYYQHSIGLRPFKKDANFSQLFSNDMEARKAHDILSSAMAQLKNQRFPSGADFVIEYSIYLERLADEIRIK